MDRDPQSILEDLYALDDVILALDPRHFWKFNDASGNAADSGFGSIALNVTGTPLYAQATGLTDITGVTIADTSFWTPASALPESTTTFTIFCLFKPLHDYVDVGGAILVEHGDLDGFYFVVNATAAGAGLKIVTTGGALADLSSGLDGTIVMRQTQLIGVVVTAGVARYFRNGVGFDGGDGTDDTIPTFTPTRVGGTASSTNMLRGVLSRLVYMPGVALTDAQMAAVWSARFSCATATLAVVNQALNHIGQSHKLTSLSSGSGAAYTAARDFYPTAVESILRDFTWPFARRYATLTLVGGTSDTAVNSDWQYSYRAPDRMVRPLRIIKEGQKQDYDATPPPYELVQDSLGWLIFTDVEDAELRYIHRPTCPARDGDVFFREALAWYLAALFVPTLSKNEKTQADCYAMATFQAQKAGAAAANESEPQDRHVDNDPDHIRIR